MLNLNSFYVSYYYQRTNKPGLKGLEALDPALRRGPGGLVCGVAAVVAVDTDTEHETVLLAAVRSDTQYPS